jgi:hypothetical protein
MVSPTRFVEYLRSLCDCWYVRWGQLGSLVSLGRCNMLLVYVWVTIVCMANCCSDKLQVCFVLRRDSYGHTEGTHDSDSSGATPLGLGVLPQTFLLPQVSMCQSVPCMPGVVVRMRGSCACEARVVGCSLSRPVARSTDLPDILNPDGPRAPEVTDSYS